MKSETQHHHLKHLDITLRLLVFRPILWSCEQFSVRHFHINRTRHGQQIHRQSKFGNIPRTKMNLKQLWHKKFYLILLLRLMLTAMVISKQFKSKYITGFVSSLYKLMNSTRMQEKSESSFLNHLLYVSISATYYTKFIRK